jgi:Ca2+-binding EF-hand superfamily protein
LIEKTFRAFDSGKKGYITTTDLRSLTPNKSQGQTGDDQEKLSLSGFPDLLAENMKNRYLPKNETLVHSIGKLFFTYK